MRKRDGDDGGYYNKTSMYTALKPQMVFHGKLYTKLNQKLYISTRLFQIFYVFFSYVHEYTWYYIRTLPKYMKKKKCMSVTGVICFYVYHKTYYLCVKCKLYYENVLVAEP